MFNKIINQKDTQCSGCCSDIVRGEWCYNDNYGGVICENCWSMKETSLKK